MTRRRLLLALVAVLGLVGATTHVAPHADGARPATATHDAGVAALVADAGLEPAVLTARTTVGEQVSATGNRPIRLTGLALAAALAVLLIHFGAARRRRLSRRIHAPHDVFLRITPSRGPPLLQLAAS
jgi:hypothetical protein